MNKRENKKKDYNNDKNYKYKEWVYNIQTLIIELLDTGLFNNKLMKMKQLVAHSWIINRYDDW